MVSAGVSARGGGLAEKEARLEEDKENYINDDESDQRREPAPNAAAFDKIFSLSLVRTQSLAPSIAPYAGRLVLVLYVECASLWKIALSFSLRRSRAEPPRAHRRDGPG
jgi:hypothetical protein